MPSDDYDEDGGVGGGDDDNCHRSDYFEVQCRTPDGISKNELKRESDFYRTQVYLGLADYPAMSFLAVQNSSIGDLVPWLVPWSLGPAPLTFRHYRVTLETCDL